MTNVSRPIHLQIQRPTPVSKQSQPLSPTSDSLPSQILPNLFVGNLEQTNKETLNRLNISYILSLGLLPLISNNTSPTSPTTNNSSNVATANSNNNINSSGNSNNNNNNNNSNNNNNNIIVTNATTTITSMPSQNSSKDFKIKIRSSNNNSNLSPLDSDENKGVKLVRSIHCKCINIADNSEQILAKFFDEAHQFIDEARRKKCNVLVHCLAGISRSPTIAIAYLMRVNSLRLQDAYNLVKQCRPQIDPNLSFVGQLMIYEKSLEGNAVNSSNTPQTTTPTST